MKESIQEQVPHRTAAAEADKTSSGAAPMADHRASASAQLKMVQLMSDGPRAIAQRMQMDSIGAQALQRVEDEEPLQGKADPLQRMEEEEPLQGKADPLQRVEEDEPLQG